MKQARNINKNIKKMGAPRKEIDYSVFEGLCRAQCTEVEIAAIFQIDVDTLNARIKERYEETFSEVYKKYSAAGKLSLRRAQIKLAEAGNATMLIWCGKQYLGQRDRHDVEHSGEVKVEPNLEVARNLFRDLLLEFSDVPREVIAARVGKRLNVDANLLVSEAIN